MINAIRLKSAREALGMETFVLPETGERQLPSEEEKELAEILPSRKGSRAQKQHCPIPRLDLCLLPNEAASVP